MPLNPWDSPPPSLTEEDFAPIEDQAKRKAEAEQRRAVRRHPVFKMLKAASGGSLASEAELDGLGITPTHRAAVEAALAEIHATRESGQNQGAQLIADERGVAIVEALPKDQQSPDYLRPDDPTDDAGPAELAEAVTAW